MLLSGFAWNIYPYSFSYRSQVLGEPSRTIGIIFEEMVAPIAEAVALKEEIALAVKAESLDHEKDIALTIEVGASTINSVYLPYL